MRISDWSSDVCSSDLLEPSAGTGLLAILAEIAGGSLILNELAETRADLLSHLFPAISVTRFDAAQIHDHLDPANVPTVEIGRASCRERVCQYVEISVVAGSLKKKNIKHLKQRR